MAGEFRRLPLKKFQKAESRKDTLEQKYWKGFQFPTIFKEHSGINHIEFSPVTPYDCLVTCSGKIQIFAPYTHEIKRTSNRNKENVYGARYRSDGKLMVAGGDSGLVQVLDVNSRSILRNLRGHSKATHVCSFGKENTKIFSASDDKTVRSWDLPTEKETLTIKAHKDFIRCGCISPANSDQFVTGSYDHTVKVWDCRSSSASISVDHGAPVECVLMHQNGSICLSAGGNYIKVWDLLAGGKLFHQFSNHQKTITAICFDADCKRLLSGGLDRHVKIYDVADFSIVAGLDYPSAVLAMDLSRDGNHLAVGMTDGAISLRHRPKSSADKENIQKRQYTPTPGTYQYRMRNQSSKPDEDDFVVRKEYQQRRRKVDKHLQKFRYHDALDAVFCEDKGHVSVPYVISVITELSRRDALEIALADRDADSLMDIVEFLVNNVTNPLYAKVLTPFGELLLDMYSGMIGKNRAFDGMLHKLNLRLKRDLEAQEEMLKLLGGLEQLFSLATPPPNVFQRNDSAGKRGSVTVNAISALIDEDIDFQISQEGEKESAIVIS